MGLHVLLASENVSGNRRRLVFDLSFTGTYPDGGEPLTPRQLLLWSVEYVEIQPVQSYWFQYDRTTQRLHVYTFSFEDVEGDIGVFFTEPGDALEAPMKFTASQALSGDLQEVATGTDLTGVQHVRLAAEGI